MLQMWDTCYKCGNKATSQRIAELQCTMLAAMSINNERATHHMTVIKTNINKDMIKDGTIKIGHNNDMSKGISNQQHRHSHHHQHRQYQQAWHSPSAPWRTSTTQQHFVYQPITTHYSIERGFERHDIGHVPNIIAKSASTERASVEALWLYTEQDGTTLTQIMPHNPNAQPQSTPLTNMYASGL